jgi:hypothetical protein
MNHFHVEKCKKKNFFIICEKSVTSEHSDRVDSITLLNSGGYGFGF